MRHQSTKTMQDIWARLGKTGGTARVTRGELDKWFPREPKPEAEWNELPPDPFDPPDLDETAALPRKPYTDAEIAQAKAEVERLHADGYVFCRHCQTWHKPTAVEKYMFGDMCRACGTRYINGG